MLMTRNTDSTTRRGFVHLAKSGHLSEGGSGEERWKDRQVKGKEVHGTKEDGSEYISLIKWSTPSTVTKNVGRN